MSYAYSTVVTEKDGDMLVYTDAEYANKRCTFVKKKFNCLGKFYLGNTG